MKTERMVFGDRQPRLTYGGNKRVLVLVNEEKVVMNDENGEEVTQWEYDGVWANCSVCSELVVLESLRNQAIEDLAAYDTSTNVNNFVVNGTNQWVDVEWRTNCSNSINRQKEKGRTEYTVFFDKKSPTIALTLPIPALESMLADLEVYAYDSMSATKRHKMAIEGLTTIEDVLAYDYTEGYPAMLNFDTTAAVAATDQTSSEEGGAA